MTEAIARQKEALSDSEEIVEIWEKEPSVQAFADLINRALDKPKEPEIEIRVSDETALLARLDQGKLRMRQVAERSRDHAADGDTTPKLRH